jgi:hypothetical protein
MLFFDEFNHSPGANYYHHEFVNENDCNIDIDVLISEVLSSSLLWD